MPSEELQKLLCLRWEDRESAPRDKVRNHANYMRALNLIVNRLPAGSSRDDFLAALDTRYRDYCRERRKTKFPTMPPSA